MVVGAPDHTIKIWLKGAFDLTDKIPIYEIEPCAGRYQAAPDDLTEGDWVAALTDIKGRLIVNINDIEDGVTVEATIGDDWTRELGLIDLSRVLGSALAHANPVIARLTDGSNFYDVAKTGQLPAALDGTDLKVHEQGTVTVSATDLDIRDLAKATDEVYAVLKTDAGAAYDSRQIRALTASDIVSIGEITTKDYDSGAGTDTQAVIGLLLPKSGGAVAGGTATDPLRVDPTGTTTQPVSASQLPAALDGTDLKVKEQSPITDFPDSAVATLLGGGLPAALDGTDLKVKEQSPITDFPDSAVATLLAGGLPSALATDALKVREQGTITATVDSYASTTPVIYNVDITSADTEYDQALPANTRKFLMMTRDRSAWRLAFETAKVATPTEPYLTLAENDIYYEDHVKLASVTVYFASAGTSKEMEILAWT